MGYCWGSSTAEATRRQSLECGLHYVLGWNSALWKSTCTYQWPLLCSSFSGQNLHAQRLMQRMSSSKTTIFLKCYLGLSVREYNDNDLCLQRVFLSLWCLSTTRLFTYTQVPTLLNSCKPTRSLLSNVVNTCATMFIFFSLSPGTLPAKEIKPLYRVEFKSFPLWRKYYNPYHLQRETWHTKLPSRFVFNRRYTFI